MALYRDPHIQYRQPGVPYRGAPETVPGIDLDRLGSIQIEVVDKFGKPYGELPASAITNIGSRLIQGASGDAGSASIKMATTDPNVNQVLIGEREVRIIFWDAIREDTGEPFIWWGRAVDDDTVPGSIDITLEDVSSWFKERLLSVDKAYDSVEQLDIAWDLISFAQTGPNMDLNILGSYTPSGSPHTRHYAGDQKPYIWDLLANWVDNLDGFDWWVDYNLSGQRLWVPEYPQRGIQTDIVLEWGKNVVGYRRKRSTRSLVTRYWAQGGDDGNGGKVEWSYEDVAASAKYGVRERAGQEGGQDATDAYLQSQAQARVQNNNRPSMSLELAVWEGSVGDDTEPVPILGRLWPGDFAQVIIDDGPVQLNTNLRVLGMKFVPGSGIDLEVDIAW